MAGARSTKTTAPEAPVEEYDFDNWSEEDEEKALEDLAPKIKHIIVERNFIGRFEDGVIVKLPLKITLEDIEALGEEHDNPVDQVKVLLSRLGGPEAMEEFVKQDMAHTVAMSRRFFEVFHRISGASVPES